MLSVDQLAQAIDALYEAAAKPDGWNAFFVRFGRIIPFATAEFVLFDAQNRNYGVEANHGMCSEAKTLYVQHYAAVDEWYLRAKGVVKEGWVGDGRILCPNDDLVRTEFYNDFLRKFGWLHECAAVIEMHSSAMSVLTMMRAASQAEFSKEEIRAIQFMLPHLKRALTLHRRIVDLEFCQEAQAWILDRVPFGIVLLDNRGRVLLANRQARQFAAGGVIRLSKAGVNAQSPREDSELQALVRSAIKPSQFTNAGGSLLLRPYERPRIAVQVTPIRTEMFGVAPAACICLTTETPESPSRADALRSLFHLTPAEARLADQLAGGVALSEAAENLGITMGTARTQLKSVFRKTDTSRQAELVRLVLLLPSIGK